MLWYRGGSLKYLNDVVGGNQSRRDEIIEQLLQ